MTVTIHDILGRQVTELVSGQMEPGHHSVSWNGTDQHSNPVTAGVYFLQINSADYTDFMKLILLK